MTFEAQVTIKGSRAAIWAAIADIANAAHIVKGIDRIEVVDKPARGLVGLRWRETRMLFGKPATVEKVITDAAENEFFDTRSESDGYVFTSSTRISEAGDSMTLSSRHVSTPQGLVGKVLMTPMGFLFKGVARKALVKDLNDIKSAVEQGARRA